MSGLRLAGVVVAWLVLALAPADARAQEGGAGASSLEDGAALDDRAPLDDDAPLDGDAPLDRPAPLEGPAPLDDDAPLDEDLVPAAELRLLPPDPCERLTISFAVSELDRQEARAGCLAAARLANRQDRIDEGVLLLGFGVMSAIVGGVVTGLAVSGGDDLWTSFGLGTAGWGVINAAFSLALFDVSGAQLDAIEGARGLTSEALVRAREEAAASQDATATLIAVNAGLDVFYIVTGLLMFVIGEQAAPDERWLMGYGAAMAAQGGVLLAYDAVTWGFAADRASRLRALLAE